MQHSGDATLLCASFNEKWRTAPQRPLYTSIVAFLYCIQIRFWILYGQAATMYVSECLLFAKKAGWVLKNKIFGQKNNILKGSLWIHQLTVYQKLDMVLENRMVQNWSYQKIILTKHVLINYYYLLKKKIRKIWFFFLLFLFLFNDI